MTRIKALGVAVAATALSVVATTAAYGESTTTADGVGDIWIDPDTQAAPGSYMNVDIVSTAVRHARHAVFYRATYAELEKNDEEFINYFFFRAHAPRDEFVSGYRADVIGGPGQRKGELRLSGDDNGCGDATATHRIDYAANTITVKIPRSCIGTPKWLRYDVDAQAGMPSIGSEDDPQGIHFDDANSAEFPALEYSKRIHRAGLRR